MDLIYNKIFSLFKQDCLSCLTRFFPLIKKGFLNKKYFLVYGTKNKISLARLFILFNEIFSLNKKAFLNKKYFLAYGTKSKIIIIV